MVPRGFAHGFYSKGESTIVNFCDNDYDASAEFGFNPLGFDEIVALGELIVSDKDMHQPTFGITS
jgi:dTDP-4-dehydrorhamnose 3,5-epimerase-like enzyme